MALPSLRGRPGGQGVNLKRGMTGEHETPCLGAADFGGSGESAFRGLASDHRDRSPGVTVRELELLTCERRLAGDAGNTERVRHVLLSLLKRNLAQDQGAEPSQAPSLSRDYT